jgi:hypothetical protein
LNFLFNYRKARELASGKSQEIRSRDGVKMLEQGLAEKVKLATGFQGQVFLRTDKNIIPSLDVRIERNGDDYLLHVPQMGINDDRRRLVLERAPTAIAWMYLAGPDVTAVDFHLSDGQLPSLAQCSFSSCDATKVLVPDFYFFRDHGYQRLRDWIARCQTPWKERSDDLVWRGRLTGAGLFSVDPAQKDNPLIRQRLRMAMHAKETPIDFGFVSAVTSLEEHILGNVGFMADRIEAKTWGGRKFAIDIDGFSSTWDNMFHRLLMGNCVLKVESQMGFRQWYYDHLSPYENFIPVKKDLSDLVKQIDWVLENDDKAQDIAHAGQQLAESMTWDAVASETRQRLRKLVGLSE